MSQVAGPRLFARCLAALLASGACHSTPPATLTGATGPHATEPRQPVVVASSEKPRAERALSQADAIGGAYPTSVEYVAADGRWLVLCQASRDSDGNRELSVRVGPRGELRGDVLSLELDVVGRSALPIQALWAVDKSQRWLVVKRQGQPALVDTLSGSSSELDATELDLAESPAAYPLHRAIAFDNAPSPGLLVARASGPERFSVERRELTGGAASASVGFEGKLFQLRTSPDGAYWILETVEHDTNQNGRLDLPLTLTSDKPRCHAPLQSFAAFQPQGDALVTRLYSTRSGKVHRVDDFAGPFGDDFLFRDSHGVLWLQKADSRVQLASANCGAQVVHADPARGLVLIACRGLEPDPRKRRLKRLPPVPPRARLPLWLVGEGVNIDLKLEVGPLGTDHWPEIPSRLVPIHAGVERGLLDLDERKLLPLGPRDSVLATFGTRALVVRPDEVELVDVLTAVSLAKLSEPDILHDVEVNAGFVLVAPYVFGLVHGRVLGKIAGEALALSSDGRVLVASQAPRDRELMLGPLYWRHPR